jgi:hypothetical protein
MWRAIVMDPLESSAERRLHTLVVSVGGLCWKLLPSSAKGIPDRLVMLPGGKIWFIELKRATGRPSKAQCVVRAKLEALGCKAAFLYGSAEVTRWFEEEAGL